MVVSTAVNSIASVSQAAWGLLFVRDRGLYTHLQGLSQPTPVDTSEFQAVEGLTSITTADGVLVAAGSSSFGSAGEDGPPSSSSSVDPATKSDYKGEAISSVDDDSHSTAAIISDKLIQTVDQVDEVDSQIPRCVVVLGGWLETGFLGWFREHTSTFIWDQLLLMASSRRGGIEVARQFVPHLCCCLLVMMKAELMGVDWRPTADSSGQLTQLRKIGQALKTKVGANHCCLPIHIYQYIVLLRPISCPISTLF
jgi:hypothetical protein